MLTELFNDLNVKIGFIFIKDQVVLRINNNHDTFNRHACEKLSPHAQRVINARRTAELFNLF